MSISNNEYQGYKDVLEHYRKIKTEIPIGITLTKRGNKLSFQFKTKNKERSTYSINEKFTIYGLNKALEKALLLAEKLKNYESENEFWAWYEENIKKVNQNAINDLIAVKDAIDKVRKEFFITKDKRGLDRIE
ncbi:MAG: site-specific integrase, partial [Geminocystis sp. GBBB08]|nr:site-specific integrase [Geminocystis sp. GBBB08]